MMDRRGLTLVELLVVIAIIGVMVGLLLPSVQAARENARLTSCKNNLLQISLAVEGYHSTFNVFPAGTVTDRLPARMFADGKDHGWLVQVRPFLDGGFEFAEQWSSVQSAYHPTNWKLTRLGPNAMACPSSPITHRSKVTPLSYAGIHDGTDAPIDTDSRGFFVANRFLRTRDVPDGLSFTLSIGEIMVDPSLTFFWTSGNQSTLRSTGLPIGSQSHVDRNWMSESRTGVGYGRYCDPMTIDYQALMKLWSPETESTIEDTRMLLTGLDQDVRAASKTNGSSTAPPPAADPQYTIPILGPDSSKPMALGSLHAGKINASFADGRVVTLSDSIDGDVFAQIGIRNDQSPLEKPLTESP